MPKIKHNCGWCGKFIWKYKDKSKNYNNHFCNRQCSSLYRKRQSKIFLTCDTCKCCFKITFCEFKGRIKRGHINLFCGRNCYEIHEKIYPNTIHLRNKVRQKKIWQRYSDELHPLYITHRLLNVKMNELPKDLIQLKRKQIKLYRLNNEKRKRLTQTT